MSVKAFLALTVLGGTLATAYAVYKATIPEVLNVDGDLRFDAEADAYYWNPHKVGLQTALWDISFNNVCRLHLKSDLADKGHIAAGSFYMAGFKVSPNKIPLEGPDIFLDVDLMVENVSYVEPEWLRIAVASAFYSLDPDVAHFAPLSVLYTEFDVWDGPNTDADPHPGIIYQGPDVQEFKVDQLPLGQWQRYIINISDWIKYAWGKYAVNGLLESVYVVIECGSEFNPTIAEASVLVKNLFLRRQRQ